MSADASTSPENISQTNDTDGKAQPDESAQTPLVMQIIVRRDLLNVSNKF